MLAARPLRDQFLLDRDVIFLNHGSFGACPLPVFARYQEWQHELERQPVEFLGRRYDTLLNMARSQLAIYLNADVQNLIFVPNATAGLNLVGRSLPLGAGDDILTTDLEYGALDLMWDYVSGKTGVSIVRQPIPLPFEDADAIVDALWQGVTPRTRLIFISHMTSNTALILPVAEICRRARQAGILTMIDGAHVPGHLPLDLEALGADFYAGNCHKWLCAPKGSAFLYVRAEHHALIDPLIISWGCTDAAFDKRNQWQGTQDVAAYLTVPEAIGFQMMNDWHQVRTQCHQLASDTRRRIGDLTGLDPISADSPLWYGQMVAVPLPDCDAHDLKTRLYDDYRVEVPVTYHHDRHYVRVSFQAYNTQEDADALVQALAELLQQAAGVG